MSKVCAALLCAAAVMPFAPEAFGDALDPALYEDGSHCSGTYWCAGSGTALDPLSGLTTLVYYFNTSTTNGIPRVVAGDVKLTEGDGAVGDLFRFEMLGGTTPVLFIYSSDTSGGLPADVGLPTSYQANLVTIAEETTGGTPNLYTPSRLQPGFGPSYVGGNEGTTIYGLILSPDAAVPEPSSLIIMGCLLLGLAMVRRWRARRRA